MVIFMCNVTGLQVARHPAKRYSRCVCEGVSRQVSPLNLWNLFQQIALLDVGGPLGGQAIQDGCSLAPCTSPA